MNKKGTLLAQNVIFILLNLLFLAIVILFLAKQGSGAIVLEQSYAKNIALLIDSAKPVRVMKLNMEQGFELARKNNVDEGDMVQINGNVVTVKLSEKGGYDYSFFNDVEVSEYPIDDIESNMHLIKVNGYKDE